MTHPNSGSVVLESPAKVYYEYHGEFNEAEGMVHLLANGRVEFWTRTLSGDEKHHWYDRSEILDVTSDKDGFTVKVVYPLTNDGEEEIVRYFYEVDRTEVDRWVKALVKSPETHSQPASPS